MLSLFFLLLQPLSSNCQYSGLEVRLGDVKKDTYCKYIPEIPQSFKITTFSGV